MKKINNILLISVVMILSCSLISFVNIDFSSTGNGPKITFKQQKAFNPAIQKITYEDMQGLNYHSNKNVVLRKIKHYTATSAYEGKNYLNTSVVAESASSKTSLTNNTLNFGASNGHRTGGTTGMIAHNVSMNSMNGIKMGNRTTSTATNNSAIAIGTIYGAVANHDHSVGDMNENGVFCGETDCDAEGKWVYNSATGVWDIEWEEAPLNEMIIPLFMFVLLYIAIRRKI